MFAANFVYWRNRTPSDLARHKLTIIMKRILSVLALLLCFSFAPDTAARNYDNLEPLTLLNRSVLDRSRRAILRDDVTTRSAAARLISEADLLVQHTVPSPTVSDLLVLKTVCSEVKTLGEAYYLSGQEKYAAKVYDVLREHQGDARAVIVDIRGNHGGDMGPMVAAVSPLLPDGELMHFDIQGTERTVTLENGTVNGGGSTVTVEDPFKLNVPVATILFA